MNQSNDNKPERPPVPVYEESDLTRHILISTAVAGMMWISSGYVFNVFVSVYLQAMLMLVTLCVVIRVIRNNV